MHTGYTAAVCDGKMTEFKDFALQCARAFGALITMRDEPFSGPVPEKIEPSSYAVTRYAEIKDRLRDLKAMTPEQAQIAATKYFDDNEALCVRMNRERDEENERLDAMLAKVNAWTPPTSEHEPMKKFMLEQLGMSKSDYTSQPEERVPGSQWRLAALAKAERDLDYYAKEVREENERAKSRTEWLVALRGSL